MLGAVTAVVVLLGGGPAVAQVNVSGPPPLGDTVPPPVAPPGPSVETVQDKPCVGVGVNAGAGGALPAASPAQAQLGYRRAWQFGTGQGQVVAVIDTGVRPNPRLTVVPGGDYVNADGNGLTDCDAHGSIVASIINAKPASTDSYAGVAPGATLLSIRQYSADYRPTDRNAANGADNRTETGFGDVVSLARAIVWAAEKGATVINISEAACGPAGAVLVGDQTLGAALRYAVDVKKVVVVAAAGNAPTPGCENNNDPRGLAPPATVASPAWWDDYVLTVGSVNPDGSPSGFSLSGPWVDVAAPGTTIVALNPVVPGPALVNQLTEPGGAAGPIEGTSFAAPFVAGTVALVRQRFPGLDPRQVMARIEATAHAPAGGWNPQVGHGVVNPVAAVTDVPAVVAPQRTGGVSAAVSPTVAAPARDNTPRTVALVGSAAALGAVVVTYGVMAAVQRHRRRSSSGRAG